MRVRKRGGGLGKAVERDVVIACAGWQERESVEGRREGGEGAEIDAGEGREGTITWPRTQRETCSMDPSTPTPSPKP